jgi:hypothetical protein
LHAVDPELHIGMLAADMDLAKTVLRDSPGDLLSARGFSSAITFSSTKARVCRKSRSAAPEKQASCFWQMIYLPR